MEQGSPARQGSPTLFETLSTTLDAVDYEGLQAQLKAAQQDNAVMAEQVGAAYMYSTPDT